MLKRKVFLFILSVLMTFVFITGCGNNSSNEGKDETNQVSKDSLIVAFDVDPDSLDPQQAISGESLKIINNIYDTLVDCIDYGPIEPRLAEKWDISPDGLKYTLYLKKGVKWQNGETFTADDVKYTFERAMESPYCFAYTSLIDNIEIIDENTVAINLKSVDPFFLQNLSLGNLAIVNEKAVMASGEDYGRNPVGTGAYKLSSWNRGDKIVLDRFDDSWRGNVSLKNITLRIIPDRFSQTVALQSGEVDVIVNVATSDIESLKSDSNFVYTDTQSASVRYIGINVNQEPFDNKLVRQAISYAIDKNAIIKGGEDGFGVEAKAMILEKVPGYADMSYTHNPDKAKELLKEAGYPNGFDSEITVTARFENLIPIIQQQLSEIGINVKVNKIDQNAFFQNLSNNKIFVMSCASLLPNPDLYNLLFSSKYIEDSNLTYTNNKEIDSILEIARVETDEEKRTQLYEQAHSLFKEEATIIPLFSKLSTMVYKKGIKGLEIDHINMFYFYDVSWE